MRTIGRYDHPTGVTSPLDHFDDAVDWLRHLTAVRFVESLLRQTHGVPAADARGRARRIMPHVQDAIAFIEQANGGPTEVAFLPAYYAILNLAKVYILFSPKHAQLSHHARYHGAKYEVGRKDSQGLLTEEIVLKPGGALALFYEVLTGRHLTSERRVRLDMIYPLIRDISVEYTIATRRHARLATLRFNVASSSKEHRVVVSAQPRDKTIVLSKQNLPALSVFRKTHSVANSFESVDAFASESDARKAVPNLLRREYLYSRDGEVNMQYVECAISPGQLPMTQEYPIALAFFHMSSVVRYKPEFLEKLRSSTSWPMLSVMSRHSLYQFILLCWSFVNRQEYHLQG